MQKKHEYHSVLLQIKKGRRNVPVDTYTTPGFAEEYLGTKDNRTELGDLILRSFRERFEGM